MRLLVALGAPGRVLGNLVDSIYSAMLTNIAGRLSQLLSNPPTGADAASHLTQLQALADDGSDFLLTAHSQGNLFVNLAYDGLRASRAEAATAVVHVAPASPTLRGEHRLADIDLVINGLRVFGINTVPPVNLTLPASRADLSGHTLVGTYLDATRAGRGEVKQLIDNAFAQIAGP